MVINACSQQQLIRLQQQPHSNNSNEFLLQAISKMFPARASAASASPEMAWNNTNNNSAATTDNCCCESPVQDEKQVFAAMKAKEQKLCEDILKNFMEITNNKNNEQQQSVIFQQHKQGLFGNTCVQTPLLASGSDAADNKKACSCSCACKGENSNQFNFSSALSSSTNAPSAPVSVLPPGANVTMNFTDLYSRLLSSLTAQQQSKQQIPLYENNSTHLKASSTSAFSSLPSFFTPLHHHQQQMLVAAHHQQQLQQQEIAVGRQMSKEMIVEQHQQLSHVSGSSTSSSPLSTLPFLQSVEPQSPSTSSTGNSSTDDVEDHRPYRCTICDKRFRFKSNLFEHKSLHLKSHAFQCPFCGKSCRLKGNLKKHLQIHVNTVEDLEKLWKERFSRSSGRPRKDSPPKPLPSLGDNLGLIPITKGESLVATWIFSSNYENVASPTAVKSEDVATGAEQLLNDEDISVSDC